MINRTRLKINKMKEKTDEQKQSKIMSTKKSNKKEKATELHNVLAAVPYQLCPKCSGDGVVLVQNWYGSPTSISSGIQVCDVCGGKKIIPMHVIPIEYKIIDE